MRKKIGIIFITFLIMVVLFYVVIHVVNNHIAKRMERQLLECQLPPNSEIIDSVSIAGKMQGNGNGMQWFGIILIRSEMNEVELSKWYDSRVNTEEKDDEIYVKKQETPEIFEYRNYRFKNYSGEDNCYQIQFLRNIPVGFESSIWEEFLNNDLRGH